MLYLHQAIVVHHNQVVGVKPQQFGGYKKPFQRTGTYGRR